MSFTDRIFPASRRRLAELEAGGNPCAHGVAWVQGTLSPAHEARIPILDQGFLKSGLTQDVPAVRDGRFFRLDDRLDRLERSCASAHHSPAWKPATRWWIGPGSGRLFRVANDGAQIWRDRNTCI